jgi:autotransporter-associated beta strand protein
MSLSSFLSGITAVTSRFYPARFLWFCRILLFAGLAYKTIVQSHAANWSWSTSPGTTNFNANNWTSGTTPGSATGKPAAGDSLFFGTSSQLALTNDYSAATAFNGITFNNSANLFTLGGSGITLGGGITNGTGIISEAINFNLALSASRTIEVNSGSLLLGGVISGATYGLTKTGNGTLTLSGANTYSGATTINVGTVKIDAGAGGALSSSSGLTFNGSGFFNYDNTTASGSKSQSLGALTPSAGEGVVKVTRSTNQTVSLTFSSLATRTAGAALNLATGGTPGMNGTDSSISISGTSAGLLNKGVFFNGADYAYANTAGGYIRAPVYGTDSGFASVTTLAGNSATHNLLTTSCSFSDGNFFKSTKINSASAVDITISGTSWYWSGTGNGGLLRTGGGRGTGVSNRYNFRHGRRQCGDCGQRHNGSDEMRRGHDDFECDEHLFRRDDH